MLRRARPLLGTLVEIAVEARSHAIELRACAAAFAAIADVHRLMSFHEPTSDLSRLRREAHERPVAVDARTRTVLRRALEIAALSDGLFDCATGARSVALGLLPGNRASAERTGTWRDVEIGADGRVAFRRPLALDLGGIAKGYAVDRAIESLIEHGADAGCVNAGGDLRVFGAREWPVAIRRPDAPRETVALPPLRDRALATTADSQAARGHVVDPRSGRVRSRPISLSVIAPSCMDADALTKVVWLAERPPIPLLEKLDASTIVLCGPEASAVTACATSLRAVA